MSRSDHHQDLSVIGILREVWAARLFLLLGVLAGCLIATGFVLLAEPKYEARMMVGPAQPLEASMQAQFQDGQNSYVLPVERAAGRERVPHFVRFEAMLRGVSVARLLARDSRIIEGLKEDRAFFSDDGREGVQPTELAKYIGRNVRVDRFGETSLKEIVYRHRDGAFAAYFLQQIHRVSDQLIRAEMRSQVDQRIAYLERVIAKTMHAEQRRIMTNLLLEQERARMMVSMDAPVAAAVIEPAVASARAVWPDKSLLYGGFGALGLVIGYLVFGLVSYRDEVEPVVQQRDQSSQRGEDLRHQPRRPLKYGSWFQNAPDNDAYQDGSPKKDISDAAE